MSKDFHHILGGRERRISKYSGEDFREQFMDPNFETHDRITINLDGVLGFPVEFIDEVFGVLSRKYGPDTVLEKIKLEARDNFILDKITYMIKNAATYDYE